MDEEDKKPKQEKEAVWKPRSVAEVVLNMIEDVPPRLQLTLIGIYDNMPYDAQEAMDEYLRCMADIDQDGGVEALTEALKKLGKVADRHPQYEGIYKSARRDANKAVSALPSQSRPKVYVL